MVNFGEVVGDVRPRMGITFAVRTRTVEEWVSFVREISAGSLAREVAVSESSSCEGVVERSR